LLGLVDRGQLATQDLDLRSCLGQPFSRCRQRLHDREPAPLLAALGEQLLLSVEEMLRALTDVRPYPEPLSSIVPDPQTH
jgi:hypothetical protein